MDWQNHIPLPESILLLRTETAGPADSWNSFWFTLQFHIGDPQTLFSSWTRIRLLKMWCSDKFGITAMRNEGFFFRSIDLAWRKSYKALHWKEKQIFFLCKCLQKKIDDFGFLRGFIRAVIIGYYYWACCEELEVIFSFGRWTLTLDLTDFKRTEDSLLRSSFTFRLMITARGELGQYLLVGVTLLCGASTQEPASLIFRLNKQDHRVPTSNTCSQLLRYPCF